MQAYKKRGFWVGLAAFFFILLTPNPESLSPLGWAVAAVTILMAIWWATEAVPVAVTALLPLALFPMLHVTDFKTAALPYANPNIYLFMGGFILALGIESSGLHKRLALKMLIAIGMVADTVFPRFSKLLNHFLSEIFSFFCNLFNTTALA